jgi:hypothetical protein
LLLQAVGLASGLVLNCSGTLSRIAAQLIGLLLFGSALASSCQGDRDKSQASAHAHPQ